MPLFRWGEPILEIGGGSGNLSEASAEIISTDLIASPWADIACDAHMLPFRDNAFGGIVLLDILHHLARPAIFFDEVARVLRSGGRLAMVEPAITPLSRLFYNFLHQKPLDMSVDPLADQSEELERYPFCPIKPLQHYFRRKRHRLCFGTRYPEFKIVGRHTFSLFAYPLSGGFKYW